MSRIINAEELEETIDVDESFELASYVRSGKLGIIRSEKKIAIKLWIDETLETLLSETPIASDQSFIHEGESIYLSASVDDTDELRHWLISMCNHATVMEPMSLKTEIKKILQESLAYY